MRVNLLDPPSPIKVMGSNLPRHEARRLVRITAPAIAFFVIISAASGVRLIQPTTEYAAAQRELAIETAAIHYDPARKQQLQATSGRLSDVRSALDSERGAFARLVAPLVAVTNARPDSTRLSRANVEVGTITMESESRNYDAVTLAQRALAGSGHPTTIKTTMFGNDEVSWTALVGTGP